MSLAMAANTFMLPPSNCSSQTPEIMASGERRTRNIHLDAHLVSFKLSA